MLPTVVEEPEDTSNNLYQAIAELPKSLKLPLDISTFLKYYNSSNCSSLVSKPIVVITPGEPDFEIGSDILTSDMSDTQISTATDSPKSDTSSATKVSDSTPTSPSEWKPDGSSTSTAAPAAVNGGPSSPIVNGGAPEIKHKDGDAVRIDNGTRYQNGNRKYRNGNGNRGLPRRQRQERRRNPSGRNWEKTRVSGMAVTHVSSPTVVFLQTAQQQEDYSKLSSCMEQAYSSQTCRPSLVAANMLLGVKVRDNYERVRTEEKRKALTKEAGEAEGSSTPPTDSTATTDASEIEWKVKLIDRGGSAWVKEDDLNFLMAGLGDLAPLTSQYTLNEVRTSNDATQQQIEESRAWLEQQVSGAKVNCDVYRQTRETGSSVVYVDVYLDDKLLNKSLCEQGGAVEPKTSLKRLKPESRFSTSSVDDAPPSPVSTEDHDGLESARSATADASDVDGKQIHDVQSSQRSEHIDSESGSNTALSQQQQDGVDRRGRRSGGGRGGSNRRWWYGSSGGNNNNNNNRRRSQLPPLQDWAVLCYDPNTSRATLCALCEMMQRTDNRVSSPDSISQHTAESGLKDMVANITGIIATHPRLVLLLCVPPADLEDYDELERTGRSLGVCVVCVKGSSISDPSISLATKLLRELQGALLQSPALLPNQKYSNSGNNNRQRNNNRGRRMNQNRQRGYSSGGNNWNNATITDDALLQSMQAVATIVQQLQSTQSNEVLSPDGSPMQEKFTQALHSIEDLQTNYKQARAHYKSAMNNCSLFLGSLAGILVPTYQ